MKICLPAVLALGFAFPATAQNSETYLVAVPVAGLDLLTNGGAEALRLRAKRAADEVCADLAGPLTPIGYRECRAPILRAAEERIARKREAAMLARRPDPEPRSGL